MFYNEILEITGRTLLVSGAATILASLWSIPLALLLISSQSRISKAIQDLLNSLVAIPTVVLGLILYSIFSRSGPLGFLELLYTPTCISIGQSLLITPLITSVATTSLMKVKEKIWELLIALGASNIQSMTALLREGLPQIIRSTLIGFNRAVGELGVALMVGGNIKGFTRVMTTAIALEVSKGSYELALSLGIILLALSITVTLIVRVIGGRE